MDPNVRLLFIDLVDLPASGREAIFAQREISAEVRAEVEALLEFDASNDHAVTRCVADAVDDAQSAGNGQQLEPCGPYRLVRLLGFGGMGAVYLGERTDGEIEQRVAVKVLRENADRPEWRARFLRERQLLANLNHPCIARLLDAGHDGHGRPFLVMDYVDGRPIDVFCADLGLRAKLEVFLEVCDAVAYAHRHLIIHRDLKPSNILVEAFGRPKLLDFGIARLLDDTRDLTQTVDRLLTPNYASPEQLAGRSQTTATDVYSLGALLQTLLSRPPRESQDHAAPKQRPYRTTTPTDLEYVVRKALRSEPEERYVSVDAFADDIRAFLASKPVQARSGDIGYRARTFIRRYWVPIGATTVTIAALSIGLYVADHQRAIAQRRFQQVRQLANKVVALDDVLKGLPGSTKARHDVVNMSKEYLEGLAAEASSDPSLALEIASAMVVVARAQGVPTTGNLGQYQQADETLRKAEELTDHVLVKSPQNRTALTTSAEIAQDRMILADADHRNADELSEIHKAETRLEVLLTSGKLSSLEVRTAAQSFGNMAVASKNLHDYSEAIHYARRSMEVAPLTPFPNVYLSQGLSIIADCMRFSGDLEGALRSIKEARTILDKMEFPNEATRRSNSFNVLWREGTILGADGTISLGKFDEAVEVLEEALDVQEEVAQKDLNDAGSRILVASAARELGAILRHQDLQHALRAYDLGLRRIREVKNNAKARREEVRLLAGSSYVLRSLNRTAEAQHNIDTALQLLRDTKDYPAAKVELDSETYFTLSALGDQLADAGQHSSAAKTYEELLQKVMAARPDTDHDLRYATNLSRIYESLATLYRLTAMPDRASAMTALDVETWRGWDRRLPNNPYVRSRLQAATRQ